ncbi:MAG: P-loop containing nucleoside triphosphate hydrolase protein [Monoraphidium minutum]|nr:MAG: P-loop containing nucleoside triphosphate hydrolase protein [Monoraphidium minutum]
MGPNSEQGKVALKVAVRFRPLSDAERAGGAYEAFRSDPSCPERVLIEDGPPGGYGHGGGGGGGPKAPAAGASREEFVYNHVFPPAATNEQVFSELVDLEPLLEGIHTTVFAYGVTGSGKTHTMLGEPGGDEGLVQRTVHALFDEIRRRDDRVWSVRLSMMQVYNENLQDLIGARSPEAGLTILDDKIPGLAEPEMGSAEETIAHIYRGNEKRKTAMTNKNEHSSRSHLICRVTLESSAAGGDGPRGTCMRARLTLVDLAGSECADTAYGTTSERDRMAEGKRINQSLLALRRVFDALAEGGGGHVPFRESKLTQLLQESLSGAGARMTMVCAASPARCARDRDPTLSTLRFAATSAAIKISARQNVEVNPAVRVKELEAELKEAQLKVSALEAAALAMGGTGAYSNLTWNLWKYVA